MEKRRAPQTRSPNTSHGQGQTSDWEKEPALGWCGPLATQKVAVLCSSHGSGEVCGLLGASACSGYQVIHFYLLVSFTILRKLLGKILENIFLGKNTVLVL